MFRFLDRAATKFSVTATPISARATLMYLSSQARLRSNMTFLFRRALQVSTSISRDHY